MHTIPRESSLCRQSIVQEFDVPPGSTLLTLLTVRPGNDARLSVYKDFSARKWP